MDATIKDAETTPTSKQYSSRPGALIWCFRKSRDRWKEKHQELKATVKNYQNRVADLTKSREQWRLKAERAAERLAALENQIASQHSESTAPPRKKNDAVLPALILPPNEQRPARGQQYPLAVVRWFLSLVLTCHTSLRGAANVLMMFGIEMRCDIMSPDRSTGRTWLLRVGLWALLRPKAIGDDWVWMVDHSIQIGQCKCLVILGVRLSTLPMGRPLRHDDMELIDLIPMTHSNREAVAACLEGAVARTGVPRAILDDHGADLHGGVAIFCGNHPETVEVYDIKHKLACLLKASLEGDEWWKSYATQAGQAKCALQQTEMAFLVPPSQRTKSRFMNLAELVTWGERMLALVDHPSALKDQGVSAERVEAKLGWLLEYREGLKRWSGYHEQIGAALEFVREYGLYKGAAVELALALPSASGEVGGLREKIIEFVREESSKARVGECLPGSTEVLESCFGKLKGLESTQSKSGFTGLVLSLGAMVSKWTSAMIQEALERCRVRDVEDWCQKKLGQTIQSQRQEANMTLDGAIKMG